MRRGSESEKLRRHIDELQRELTHMYAELPKAEERERIRTTGNEKALTLLRESCPEGERLAAGEAVLIESRQFPGIAYGILLDADDQLRIALRPWGSIGRVCITAKDDAPGSDVLLTKLRLCQFDEKTLWTTGNFFSDGGGYEFLPKQIGEWMRERHEQARTAEAQPGYAEEACEPAPVPAPALARLHRR